MPGLDVFPYIIIVRIIPVKLCYRVNAENYSEIRRRPSSHV